MHCRLHLLFSRSRRTFVRPRPIGCAMPVLGMNAVAQSQTMTFVPEAGSASLWLAGLLGIVMWFMLLYGVRQMVCI